MQPSDATREAYIHAKIEHYHDLADECRLAGRYHAALRYVHSILTLDPRHREALAMQTMIHGALRRLTGDPPVPGEELAAVSVQTRSEVVVVADQDTRVLENLVNVFLRHGFPVVGAGSYEEALEVLEQCSPDIVISEVNFESGPRGYDLFELVRTTKNKSAVFFLLTTRHDRDAELVGRRLGVDDFFVKPVDAESVVATVLRVVSRQRA